MFNDNHMGIPMVNDDYCFCGLRLLSLYVQGVANKKDKSELSTRREKKIFYFRIEYFLFIFLNNKKDRYIPNYLNICQYNLRDARIGKSTIFTPYDRESNWE